MAHEMRKIHKQPEFPLIRIEFIRTQDQGKQVIYYSGNGSRSEITWMICQSFGNHNCDLIPVPRVILDVETLTCPKPIKSPVPTLPGIVPDA